jgi:hypothetical protein
MNVASTTSKYSPFPAPTGSLHLQYVGEQIAIEVESLVAGCITVWNSGGLEMCVGVERVSPKFFSLMTKTVTVEDGKMVVRDGEPFARRCKVGRMVGYSPAASAKFAAQ